VLECAFAHSLPAASNDQKDAVHQTNILVRLRGVYSGLFSELGGQSIQLAGSEPSVRHGSATYLIDVTSETTRR